MANWIQNAIKHPGALHKELGVHQGQNIPQTAIQKATQSTNPIEAKRAQLALTLSKMRK